MSNPRTIFCPEYRDFDEALSRDRNKEGANGEEQSVEESFTSAMGALFAGK
jgi:hypothetical protein